MHIVQIVPVMGMGTGIAGVASSLDRAFRDLGAEVETFTYATAQSAGSRPRRRRVQRPSILARWPRLLDAVQRSRRLIWFSIVGGSRARAYMAERPDAVSICHNNAMAGDVYVNHGIVMSFVRSRPQALKRVVRNPTALFAHVRDRIRYRGRTHRSIVCLTETEADELRRTYGRVGPPITVIPNGVDLDAWRPPSPDERREVRELFQLPEDARVALFVGIDFERKGLPQAIEALRYAPSVLLLVVGGAQKDVDTARAHAEQHGVSERVLLLGQQQQNMRRYFAVSDFFVMPSSYEPFGLVYLEALASGLPVIATPVGIAPEVIRDGDNGFIVGRDPQAIGERIAQLAETDLGPWRARARASVEQYSWTAVARQYLALAERILAERRGS